MAKQKLIVDIGNTRIKWAFAGNEDAGTVHFADSLTDHIPFDACQQAIISSVRGKPNLSFLNPEKNIIFFSHTTPIPLRLDYQTPHTLGPDRLAAAVGASGLFPNQTVLVIDAGTCITYDLVDKQGVFRGGAISPGIQLRMRAMHEFTSSLPDIKNEWKTLSDHFPGRSTKDCMAGGVIQAMIHEIEGYICLAKKEFGDLSVILTGGDAGFFESKLKETIFVRQNLVMTGLNRILKHNEVDK
ncbi:MAG: type III pantothenate kinase [Cyclobacteriaceae bacterium]|nr:type III pantothenate kinase [Cyclobacteriaceae bacterium]